MPVRKNRRHKRNYNKDGMFATERVLADSELSVQDLLVSTKSKATYQQIVNSVRTKLPGYHLSDAKTKTKTFMLFKPSAPKKGKKYGPTRRNRRAQ